jgi:transcriptional regulator with XRE-family HTH domain
MQTRVIAAYFRELRKGYRYTQQALADAADVGKRTVERLDRGDRPVSIRSLEPIMVVLGASADEVHYLMTNPSATVSEAKELARAQLQRSSLWQGIPDRSQPSHQDPRLRGLQAYVRTVRERQHISRKVLADMLGVGIAALADWEAGRSNALPLPAVLRAIMQLIGAMEDLKQIDTATEGHEALGRRLAEARVPILLKESTPEPSDAADAHSARIQEQTIQQRVAALEGIVQFILSLLKRISPTEARDIEQSTARWFPSTRGTQEGEASIP